MEIASILIGMGLLAVSLAYVSQPFQKKPRKGVMTVKAHKQKADRRASVLSALRDLDFDFKTGKVSDEDYTPLRARLIAEAAQCIEMETEEDQKLEELIQARRTAGKSSARCDQCGSPAASGQRFCAKCGSAVTQELCPHCGKKVRAGDLFCSSCGTRVEVRVEAAVSS